MNQVGGLRSAPRGNCPHPVSAEGPQITLQQSGKFERLARQQGRHHVRKQQVTEVVAVERPKQNQRGSGLRLDFLRGPAGNTGVHFTPTLSTYVLSRFSRFRTTF